MENWWDLGEGIGYQGSELALFRITCPFCLEKGNFSFEHKATKKKPNSSKVLHFDTLKCGNCAGYVMVLWSASEFGRPGRGLHGFHVLPWPLRINDYPEHWTETVGRYWIQAHRSAKDENWDAASMTARSALQVALREQGAQAKSLKGEIDILAAKGILPPHMKDWAHELRELGNEAAHPDQATAKAEPKDVLDVIEFLDFLLQYLYDLPYAIKEYRKRRNTENQT
jgi:hypothetical protein